MMFHRTQRLFLRPAWVDDAPAIAAGIADEQIVRNLARAPWPYTVENAVEFLSLPQTDALPRFVLTLPEEHGSRLVGMCGIHYDTDGEPELGYWIARAHWGRGYATEAARGVVVVAQAHGIARIRAGHFSDNPASGRVLRKAGFVPMGVTAKRFSLARGGKVDSIEYALDLSKDAPMGEWKRAA